MKFYKSLLIFVLVFLNTGVSGMHTRDALLDQVDKYVKSVEVRKDKEYEEIIAQIGAEHFKELKEQKAEALANIDRETSCCFAKGGGCKILKISGCLQLTSAFFLLLSPIFEVITGVLYGVSGEWKCNDAYDKAIKSGDFGSLDSCISNSEIRTSAYISLVISSLLVVSSTFLIMMDATIKRSSRRGGYYKKAQSIDQKVPTTTEMVEIKVEE